MNRLRILTVGCGLLSIVFGGCLYLLYRSETLLIFKWIKVMGIYDFISVLRPDNGINSWFVYSLPDGLWLFSYIMIISAIWCFDIRKSLLYSVPLVIIAIGSEILQIPHIVSGTFDFIDLWCYIVATILGYVYMIIINNKLKRI